MLFKINFFLILNLKRIKNKSCLLDKLELIAVIDAGLRLNSFEINREPSLLPFIKLANIRAGDDGGEYDEDDDVENVRSLL